MKKSEEKISVLGGLTHFPKTVMLVLIHEKKKPCVKCDILNQFMKETSLLNATCVMLNLNKKLL